MTAFRPIQDEKAVPLREQERRKDKNCKRKAGEGNEVKRGREKGERENRRKKMERQKEKVNKKELIKKTTI